MFLNFRTTYIDRRTGVEVRDLKKISRHYLRGQFTIDLLAAIPFDTLAEKTFQRDDVIFKLFGALKLVRVLRLSRIIGHNKSSEEFKAFLKLNKLVFFLLIYLHVFGCVWWMLVSDDQNWVPPIEYRDFEWYFLYE